VKSWKTAPVERNTAVALATETGLPVPVAAILLARGLADGTSIERFLNPRLSDLSDPFLLPDMRKAADRVWRAIDRKENIAIYGDYDVDGVTSAALLIKVLGKLGGRVASFIPRRLEEGYGLTRQGLERCIQTCKPGLIVTVDCGTNSGAEIELAAKQGIDVVVTDHHESDKTSTGAVAVVNPRANNNSLTADLAGVGVAFKLCHALIKDGITAGRKEVSGVDLRNHLDLVAIGTVADVASLVEENRTLVRHGLARLNKTDSIGLKALAAVAGIKGEMDSYHIGFIIGPRLNAAGRLAAAERALELILTDDPARASELARELDAANRERKRVEDIIVTESTEEIEGYFERGKDFGLVTGRASWHAGAIGIAASRLCSRYHRPALVVAFGEDGNGHGSGRSIEELDIVEVLHKCTDLLVSFGGHKLAAGLVVEQAKFDEFRKRFNELCLERLKGIDLAPVQKIDAWLGLGEADVRLLEALDKMRPFGAGNPSPVLAAANVSIVGQPRILKEKHLKLTVASGGTQMNAIGFNMADREIPDGALDIAFHLEENTYMGRSSLQLNLKDFRPSEG
jgi:single-stranded-DNA-specific exonuclease